MTAQKGLCYVLTVGFTGDSLLPTLAALASLVAGTMFLVWLGELITEKGIGNGISLIIFAGIVAGFPGLLAAGIPGQGQRTGDRVLCDYRGVDHRADCDVQRGPPADSGAVREEHIPGRANVPPGRRDVSAAAHKFGRDDTADFCVFNSDIAGYGGDILRDERQLDRGRGDILRGVAGADVGDFTG